MPQDPNLYGQRPAKKQKKEMALSSSLSFTSQLSSLLASSSSTSTGSTLATTSSSSSSVPTSALSGRPRPSKKADALFKDVKLKRKQPPTDHTTKPSKLNLKSVSRFATEDSEVDLQQARKKMEEKAKLYAQMQRGHHLDHQSNSLVDFDRKWAEQNHDDGPSSSSSDSDSSDNDEEMVEFEDEFGRLRRVTRSEKSRYERRLARGQASTLELETMSARPKAPETLIYGDAVQTHAFVPKDEQTMEELARKRDRTPTPPPAEHYDATREIRTKGVGFYKFSRDETQREEELKNLENERQKTEQLRKEKEEKMNQRKRELEERKKQLEERRKEIGEKRAKKMADNFLDGLAGDILSGSGSGSSGSRGGG
ncbi:hypothetical protein QBC46DRAFT_382052 [Diplogelasinospora grovesii]|uniref:Uncharacterized protein n=1 Tax=Diplogelasinospora grovesii TaxID=303347 RepID=A0AAN6NAS2_9PEZI|nr:hypothetical protein QBC46DRAFT_382052 [Diplogelasinospora grovesii]